MDELIRAYLHQIVIDAAHAIAGDYKGDFYRNICGDALILLESGGPGTIGPWITFATEQAWTLAAYLLTS